MRGGYFFGCGCEYKRLHFLYGGLVLRHVGTDCSNWGMWDRHVLGCGCERMLELCHGEISSFNRPIELHFVYCWLVLRHDGTHCGHDSVHGGQVLDCGCERMLFLLRGLLPGLYGPDELYPMHRW